VAQIVASDRLLDGDNVRIGPMVGLRAVLAQRILARLLDAESRSPATHLAATSELPSATSASPVDRVRRSRRRLIDCAHIFGLVFEPTITEVKILELPESLMFLYHVVRQFDLSGSMGSLTRSHNFLLIGIVSGTHGASPAMVTSAAPPRSPATRTRRCSKRRAERDHRSWWPR